MSKPKSLYQGYRFRSEVISYAVRRYGRFSLSFREMEDLLAQRGIIVAYESFPGGVSEILCVRRVSHLDTGEPVAVHDSELIHRRSPFLGRS